MTWLMIEFCVHLVTDQPQTEASGVVRQCRRDGLTPAFGIWVMKHGLLVIMLMQTRMSFETCFDSKLPKLETKLVSALSETKCLFRLFCINTKTESLGVLIEPKQREEQQNSLIKSIFWYFFPKILGCFGLFLFFSVSFQFFRSYTQTANFNVSFEPQQTEDQPKQFDREHILVFSDNLGLFWFVSKQFCLFQLFRFRFETPKQTKTNQNFWFWFLVSRNKPKHNRNRSCFGLFRFQPKYFFFSFGGHHLQNSSKARQYSVSFFI